MLDTLARVEATPRYIVDTLRYQYQRKYETAQRGLDQLAEHFPDLITLCKNGGRTTAPRHRG